jgi:hypothetical protein
MLIDDVTIGHEIQLILAVLRIDLALKFTVEEAGCLSDPPTKVRSGSSLLSTNCDNAI